MRAVGMLLLALFANISFAGDCRLGEKHSVIVGQLHPSAANSDLDELSRWKQWESLLVECKQSLSKSRTEQALSDFLFLGYVGFASNGAATREFMASEVYPAFAKSPDVFLKVVGENPVLVESSCYYLGRYFTFEDNDEGTKKDFLSQYANDISSKLTLQDAKRCISYF